MHMGVRVRDVDDALNELRAHFDGRKTELLVGLFLDRNFETCGTFAIEGSRSKVSAPITGLIASAAVSGATYLVLAHNHPSGDPTPSHADKEATFAIARACDHIGVRVLDHLIIASGGVSSMRTLGII